MKLSLRVLVVTLVVGSVMGAGCSTVMPALPAVIAAVTDGMQVLDAIGRFVDAYFLGKPITETQKVIGVALARARSALNLALRSAQGAEALDQKQVDRAFGDFRDAYRALLALVAPLGVSSDARVTSFSATPGPEAGKLVVPEPLALTVKVP